MTKPVDKAISLYLDQQSIRFKIYSLVAFSFFLAAIACVLLKGSFNFVVSDGRGYFVYLPSLVIDGDLNFENQVMQHWGEDYNPSLVENKGPTGLIRNKYPIGLALTLLPGFLLAHLLSLLMHSLTSYSLFQPDGYSILYQLTSLLTVIFCGLLTMRMIDLMIQRLYKSRGSSIAYAVLIYWTSSHYSYYYFREPLMVHVISTFWITCVLSLGAQILSNSKQSGEPQKLILMCLAFSMALIARPTNIFVGFFVFYVFFNEAKKGRSVLFVKAAIPAVLPIFLQMFSWKILNGSWISYSYKGEGFPHWTSPYLFSTLVSSRHGLFFWSPVLLYSVLGLAWHCKTSRIKQDMLLPSLMAGGILLWFLNSSWHMWWFGDAFGARAFLELTPLFIFGIAFAVERIRSQSSILKGICLSTIVLSALYNYGLMALYITHKISRSDYLF